MKAALGPLNSVSGFLTQRAVFGPRRETPLTLYFAEEGNMGEMAENEEFYLRKSSHPSVLKECRRIVADSEIMKEDDNNWPEPDRWETSLRL
ncbi:hypothetical protein HAX54_001900 [Datura stramonium]|uniref:Uncharacterized protein n=1 Tax=Datura stramonium TaxID=4076 RepID=A0ABS8RT61_DATST|nr:hypothetical protein [Datura stramonium]